MLINSDYIDLNDEKVLLTSIQDITRFKMDQEHLKEAESRYYALFSNAPVGITVTDFSGKIFASNKAIHNLLGYSDKEFRNLTAEDFYFDKRERQQLLDETREKYIVRDFETSYRRKDGRSVAVLINTISLILGINKAFF